VVRVRGATCRGLVALLLWMPIGSSCLGALRFECEDDEACVLDDRHGQCIAPGRCAYPESECGSRLRYGPAAGPGLASTCVDSTMIGETDTVIDTDGDCGPCEVVPRECYASEATCDAGACAQPPSPSGTPCRGDDPCVVSASCDGAGTCVVEAPVECLDPPTPCSIAPGTCGVDGTCSYERRAADMPCQDGNGCTLDDRCDAAGICVAGPLCPTDNPCAVGSCSGEQCSFFPVVDGTPCGPTAANACCGGACVDLSSDAEHCGACDGLCADTEQCVDEGGTGTCMPA
jgi:hypothetical protein